MASRQLDLRISVIPSLKTCIWPASHKTACGKPSVWGRLCVDHLKRVSARAGSWDCAWPGCEQLSPAKKGLCRAHWKIASGTIDP